MEANPNLNAIKESCIELSQTAAGDTNDLGGKIQRMILCYYQDVRKQTQQSFYLALAAAAVGTFFYFYAIISRSVDYAKLGLIAGGIIHVISALNFVLYAKAARQFSTFHVCLERTNRFLLANTLCDNINCAVKKDITRQFLIETIANAPMIHIEGSGNSGKASQNAPTTIEHFTNCLTKEKLNGTTVDHDDLMKTENKTIIT